MEVKHTMEEVYPDGPSFFYVEKSTSLIYEVQFFKDYVLTRPASPMFYLAIKKLSHVDFAGEFEEYCGDHEAVKASIDTLMTLKRI